MNWLEAISKFKLFLKIERGLSENSIESYSSDLKSLYNFIIKNNLSKDFTSSKSMLSKFILLFFPIKYKNESFKKSKKLLSFHLKIALFIIYFMDL